MLVNRNTLKGKKNLIEDWVLFKKEEWRLYLDYQDQADQTRVSSGELILSEYEIKNRLEKFSILEEHSMSIENTIDLLKIDNNNNEEFEKLIDNSIQK